jgi:hypothetical protein
MEDSYPGSVTRQFIYYKSLGEKAMEQLEEAQLFWQPGEGSNSIAMIVRHLSGNMLSRFTDFLETDGEKPWRDRDAEFYSTTCDRQTLMNTWHKGWQRLLDTIAALKSNDLETVVYIRNEGHTVKEAINRQLAHYPYHVGQIVFIAKMLKGGSWRSLSIPPGNSAAYNDRKFSKERGRRHFTDDV